MYLIGTALGGSIAVTGLAYGQAFNGNPTTIEGTISYDRANPNGPGTEITTVSAAGIFLDPPAAVANWTVNADQFLAPSNTATFQGGGGFPNYEVLNRLIYGLPNTISIDGDIIGRRSASDTNPGTTIAFSAVAGNTIVVGSTANINGLLLRFQADPVGGVTQNVIWNGTFTGGAVGGLQLRSADFSAVGGAITKQSGATLTHLDLDSSIFRLGDTTLGLDTVQMTSSTFTFVGGAANAARTLTQDFTLTGVNDIQVAGSRQLTLSGAISGAGSLSATDSGTVILSGTNTYAGSTTVSGGTLIVNGSIANSSGLTVAAGAMVGGGGTLPSATINGTLSPGNSIGVININGNLILGAGAIYLVEVSPTDADRTNVSGSAQLSGELRLIFGPGSYSSRNYTILSAAGGRNGTFNTVTTQNLPSTLSADIQYTPTDVLLVTLSSQIATNLAASTSNERSVAVAQDTAFNGGLPSILALYSLPLEQVPAALNALSGEVHASTASVLADESSYARSAILGRLRQASYGGTMGAMASLTVGGPQAFADGEETSSALAYTKSPVVRKAPITAPQPATDVVFWAQGFGAWGKFDGDGNAASVRRDLAGFFTGIDTRVAGNGRVGIAAGYTGSKNNTDVRGSATVETGHVAAYGGWGFGALNLRAGGDFAFHNISTDRTIAFPGFFDRAFANYEGSTAQVFGELGYGFALANVAVEPFAGTAWVRVKTDGGAERGGAAALNVAGTTFETGYTTLGIRAASMVPVGHNMILIPRASLAWQHTLGDVAGASVLAFQNAPTVPFSISGVPVARDSLLAEAGLDLAIGRNATLGVSYIGQLARNVADHGAKGKFSYRF